MARVDARPSEGKPGSRKTGEPDDVALVRGTLAGHREDFSLLVERHQKPLYRFVLQHTRDGHAADEIVQMTFVQAYTHLANFREEASFRTWLHRVALNLCHDRGRAERRRADVSVEDALDASAIEPRLEDVVLGGTLERRIAALPDRQRTVLNLRLWGDLSFKEISNLLGTTENSAKVNYHHAIRRLRQWVTGELA
jgi:RNA polymerase sigma-70 factor (ECF subfamily)